MPAEENVTTIRKLYSGPFNAADLSDLEDLVTQEFFSNSAPPGVPRGPAGIQSLVGWLRSAFPDSVWDLQDVFATEDRVCVRAIYHGTHSGAFMGIPPTGKAFRQDQMHIMRMDGGKVAEHWACRDDLGLLRQLGVIPEPAAAGR